jgi:hypothetical protein
MKLIVGKCYKATCEIDFRDYWWLRDKDNNPVKYFYNTAFIVLNFEKISCVFNLKIFYCGKILLAKFDSGLFKFEQLSYLIFLNN